MDYKYIFGPVPSRRLGISLGIDLVPHKVCSLNCVYCECGKTTNLTTSRAEYIPVDKLKIEIDDYLQNNPAPDYITFSGSGEPTLNKNIGEILDYIKTINTKIPVAILTNGTLLGDKHLRKELLKADLIIPSLDSALKNSFIKINRPHPSINLEKYIEGIVHLRDEFIGNIWLEIFILEGYNDDSENLNALKQAILKIKPNKIQLNTLDRPGTVAKLKAVEHSKLQQIINNWKLDNVEIIAKAPERKKLKSYRNDTENAILETIKRRPCTLTDLSQILGLHINEINKYLDVLEKDKKIISETLNRGIFYRLTDL